MSLFFFSSLNSFIFPFLEDDKPRSKAKAEFDLEKLESDESFSHKLLPSVFTVYLGISLKE